MWSGLTRRIVVFTLSAAMAVGLSVHAVRATHAELKAVGSNAVGAMTAVMPASSMPSSSKCDGCGGDQKAISPAACAAYCAGMMVALPTVSVVFDVIPGTGPGHPAILIGTGHADPPDPYPPRPAVLS
jgi:hypothetical protein